MKLLKLVLVVGSSLATISGAMADTVVNFDDLTSGQAIPGAYQGFNWSANWYAYSVIDYNGNYGNTATFPSDPNAAYNGFGVVDVSLSSGAAFDFVGAYFTGWAENDATATFTAPSITVSGYNGATLVGTATMNLSPSSFTWLAANLDNVTSLDFNNGGASGQWWLMDNLTYSGAVPDGGMTIALLGGALVGLQALRRKLSV